MLAMGYIGVLSGIAFLFANSSIATELRLQNRFIILYGILVVTGFISFSYFMFAAVAIFALLAMSSGSKLHKVMVFLFLFPLLPTLDYQFSLGVPILHLTWPRLLVIAVLLPMFPGALREKPLFHYSVDKFVVIYIVLNALLVWRDASLTAGLRNVIYLGLDIAVPYFVISRYLRSTQDVRSGMFAFLVACAVVGLVNIFESVNSWHLYENLSGRVTGNYLAVPMVRAGLLRAIGPLDKPSASAFVLATGIGMIWALAPYIRSRRILPMLGVVSFGLLLTFSRGSWVAAVFIGLAYAATNRIKQFVRVAILGGLIFFGFSLSPLGDQVMALLPFVGEESGEAARTVAYREVLFDVAVKVAHENPLFGSIAYEQHPDLEAIRQLSGLLDIVNHYLLLLLSTGYTGLISFALIFLTVLRLLVRTIRTASQSNTERIHLAKVLLCTITGLLISISATSALGRVGLVLWCLAAFSVAVSDASGCREDAAVTRRAGY